ncbi:major facilitator superfamily domain-containing protein [Podospora appendiculata]|uniref:Major facilitator superfamily domain-containing protein n=1 Tax=Podospora appendiculata TaxID=314037 RepID=A0AAE1CHH2_9PEZI|nr:major facilitator superfamily domain-containing protein [Podospora appendiculata]
MSDLKQIDVLGEKEVGILSESQLSHSDDDSQILEWTAAEEKALVRKTDFIIMPLLMLGFFSLQVDRGNIANALTDNFLADVGITQFQFNIGQQLLSAGIVILEIPSNLLLFQFGPTIWIGSQIMVWGFIATFQAFIKGKGLGPYLTTRLLLGLCEAGFIPAGLYTITKWYKREETAKRFAIFFIGMMASAASTGLIAFGILRMRGICGLSGWQWIFLIEGMFTVLVGATFLSFFPHSPGNPVSLLKYRYFSERESQLILRRVLLDDPTKSETRKHIPWSEVKAVLTNWTLIPHILLILCCMSPIQAIGNYGPLLIISFGFDKLKSNAMGTIGAWLMLLGNVLFGFLADRFGVRGPLVLLVVTIFTAMVLANRFLVESHDGNLRFAFLTLAVAFSAAWHPIHGAWIALNARSAGQRSITMAVFIMAANLAGVIGGQMFQAEDAPLYKTGWAAIVGLVAVGLLSAIVANLQYVFLNRRQAKDGEKRFLYSH